MKILRSKPKPCITGVDLVCGMVVVDHDETPYLVFKSYDNDGLSLLDLQTYVEKATTHGEFYLYPDATLALGEAAKTEA